MTPYVAAGAGFLLAVLWFDLMFDVQVRGAGPPSDSAVGSIAAYYRRVTTAASPMNVLVAVVMALTLAAAAAQLVRGAHPVWAGVAVLALLIVAIGTAATRTVPGAMRLGSGTGDAPERAALARRIYSDHVLSFCAVLLALAIELAFAP
jgi:hypothetical protein